MPKKSKQHEAALEKCAAEAVKEQKAALARKQKRVAVKEQKAALARKEKRNKSKAVMKSTPPKAKPKVDKDLLQGVMGVMASVGKDKGKSTQASKDKGLAFDKKLKDGKLTNKDFNDFIIDNEKEFMDIPSLFNRMTIGFSSSDNMEYWYSKVSSKYVDNFDDLTDKQQDRLQLIREKDIEKNKKKKMKSFYDERVKGKKFTSLKKLKELFINDYNEK